MLEAKIAWRNIFRQKRRSLLTVLTLFGGFVLSSISIGWVDGTYNRIIDAFTRNRLGHIQIHARGYTAKPSIYARIDDFRDIGKILDGIPGVTGWSARFFAAGLASLEDQSAGASIIGVDPDKEAAATRFDRKISQGRPLSETPNREVVLGLGLARRLKAQIGSEITLVSQAADGSIANDLYTTVGILESGDPSSDLATLYLHIQDAQELFVLEGAAHEIAVVCQGLDDVAAVNERIKAKLAGRPLDVEPWQEFARSFYRAMQADRRGNSVLLIIIMLIVAVGVLNTVLMTVLERTREYGVLRALGTRPPRLFIMILCEIIFMTAIGSLIGAGVGYLVNTWLSFRGIALPQPFTWGGMEFSRFYTEVNARTFYIPGLTVLATALLAAIWPARWAARIDPAKALRMH